MGGWCVYGVCVCVDEQVRGMQECRKDAREGQTGWNHWKEWNYSPEEHVAVLFGREGKQGHPGARAVHLRSGWGAVCGAVWIDRHVLCCASRGLREGRAHRGGCKLLCGRRRPGGPLQRRTLAREASPGKMMMSTSGSWTPVAVRSSHSRCTMPCSSCGPPNRKGGRPEWVGMDGGGSGGWGGGATTYEGGHRERGGVCGGVGGGGWGWGGKQQKIGGGEDGGR